MGRLFGPSWCGTPGSAGVPDNDSGARIAPCPMPSSGSVYATHMRDETDRVLESIAETLTTAERANIPLVISHHKCAGKTQLGPHRRDPARH